MWLHTQSLGRQLIDAGIWFAYPLHTRFHYNICAFFEPLHDVVPVLSCSGQSTFMLQ